MRTGTWPICLLTLTLIVTPACGPQEGLAPGEEAPSQEEGVPGEEALSLGGDPGATRAAASASYCKEPAYFFKNPGFGGVAMIARRRHLCLNVPPELAGEISSYRIGPCAVKLFRERNCVGFMYTARPGSSWPHLPPDKDDKIRSIWIL